MTQFLRTSTLFLLIILGSLLCKDGFSQNYSAAYFKNKQTKLSKEITQSILKQAHKPEGLYVRIARELMGCDFVITNAAGVMVLVGTFNNDSFVFDKKLFASKNDNYFLSLFHGNKQVASEKLKL